MTPKGAIAAGKRIYCLIIMRGFDKNRLLSATVENKQLVRSNFFFHRRLRNRFCRYVSFRSNFGAEMEMSSARASLCFSISNNRIALSVHECGSAIETGARLGESAARCPAILPSSLPLREFNWIGFGAAKTAFIEMRARFVRLRYRVILQIHNAFLCAY